MATETQLSIIAWANETFGEASSLFRIATRANEEVEELLTAFSKTPAVPRSSILAEVADITIILCRFAEIFATDLIRYIEQREKKGAPPHIDYAEFTRRGYVLSRDHRAAMHAVMLHRYLSHILEMAIVRQATPTRGLDVHIRERLEWIADCAVYIANSCGGELLEEVNAKMDINRAREWELDNTGHGYHKHVKHQSTHSLASLLTVSIPLCPQCQRQLLEVKRDWASSLNQDQFDSQKAGDWYCTHCPDNGRAKSQKYAYFWEREVRPVPREISLNFRIREHSGTHTEASLFVGSDEEHRAYGGSLMMRVDEADLVLAYLLRGIPPEMFQDER